MEQHSMHFGCSGSGKSAILKLMAGADTSTIQFTAGHGVFFYDSAATRDCVRMWTSRSRKTRLVVAEVSSYPHTTTPYNE